MVIGAEDDAMEEAIFLHRFGEKVTLVTRREQFRASKIMLERARNNPKIRMLTNTIVEDVYDASQNLVTRVKLRNVETSEVWEQAVDGFFVATGHIPNNKPFDGQIELDPDGYVDSQGGAFTKCKAVFHAGDVQDRTYRQADPAARAGSMS